MYQVHYQFDQRIIEIVICMCHIKKSGQRSYLNQMVSTRYNEERRGAHYIAVMYMILFWLCLILVIIRTED